VEVYETAKTAIERARRGEGPTLMNCMTTRQHPHWEGDKDVRTKEEVQEQLQRDAITGMEKRMLEAGMISEQDIKATKERIQKLVDEALEFARKSPKVGREDALKFVYAE